MSIGRCAYNREIASLERRLQDAAILFAISFFNCSSEKPWCQIRAQASSQILEVHHPVAVSSIAFSGDSLIAVALRSVLWLASHNVQVT